MAGFVLVRFFGDYYTDLKGGGNNCWVYTVRAEIEGLVETLSAAS